MNATSLLYLLFLLKVQSKVSANLMTSFIIGFRDFLVFEIFREFLSSLSDFLLFDEVRRFWLFPKKTYITVLSYYIRLGRLACLPKNKRRNRLKGHWTKNECPTYKVILFSPLISFRLRRPAPQQTLFCLNLRAFVLIASPNVTACCWKVLNQLID